MPCNCHETEPRLREAESSRLVEMLSDNERISFKRQLPHFQLLLPDHLAAAALTFTSLFSTAISRGGGQKPDLNGAAHRAATAHSRP